MNNKILLDVIEKRQGHYCHALEVNNVFELQSIIESLYDEFIKDYTLDDIVNFFNTIELYSLNDDNENSIYNFSIKDYILSL